jgi:hypothetical protein
MLEVCSMTEPAHGVIEKIKSLRKTAENGADYWMARDIMEVLDYGNWRDFREVIGRAAGILRKGRTFCR